jgi:hypothetical protein
MRRVINAWLKSAWYYSKKGDPRGLDRLLYTARFFPKRHGILAGNADQFAKTALCRFRNMDAARVLFKNLYPLGSCR